MKELKRFNLIKSIQTHHLPLWLIMGVSLVFVASIGCKKKERLTNSTFNFGITPPAAMVLRTGSLTLTAHGSSGGGSIGVSPTWAVSPSTVGTLNVSIGSTVIFTPEDLGVATVTALFDGLMATSQIDVVTYIPDSTTFDVYNDDGLPSEAGITSDIFTSGGLNIAELSTGYTPEGVNYQRTTNAVTNDNWGVTLDDNSMNQNKDLSAFNAGTLKFALRLFGRPLTSGETLRINVQDLSTTASVDLTFGLGGPFGFSGSEQGWQEISIPISSFITGGINTSQVKVPFAIVAFNLPNGPLTFDVDAVRWGP